MVSDTGYIQKEKMTPHSSGTFKFCPGKNVSALRKVILSYRLMDDTEWLHIC